MNTRPLLSSALATVVALGLASPASAQTHGEAGKNQEKCFGVAKVGENSCANLSGTHSCAGQAEKDKDPSEWTLVPKGSCAKMGGLNAKQAKAAMSQVAAK